MIKQVKVRPETVDDVTRINEIILAAFENHPHGNNNEHTLVTDLRAQGGLSVSLVASSSLHILGHIAFSEVTINGIRCEWYGLAPVSVDPMYQNLGVGSELIISGLTAIKALGAKGCVLLGEPSYYRRFGFKVFDNLKLAGVPPEYFMALSFTGDMPSGTVEYHRAFADNG